MALLKQRLTERLQRDFVFFSLLFMWLFLSLFNFYSTSFPQIRRLLFFSRLSTFQKHALLEPINYYNLILFCIKSIPQDKDIAFINVLDDKVPAHSSVWLKGEYYIEKAPFYLYPRKIYRQINTPSSGVEYEVNFNPKEDRFILLKNKRVIYASN